MKYRKKPIEIDAEQFVIYSQDKDVPTTKTVNGIMFPVYKDERGYHIFIPTLEGKMRADNLDWVIRGIKGEYYPCKPDIFEKTYEPVQVND
jgi:hypothetical protein